MFTLLGSLNGVPRRGMLRAGGLAVARPSVTDT